MKRFLWKVKQVKRISPGILLAMGIFWLLVPGATAILSVWAASIVYSSEDEAEVVI